MESIEDINQVSSAFNAFILEYSNLSESEKLNTCFNLLAYLRQAASSLP